MTLTRTVLTTTLATVLATGLVAGLVAAAGPAVAGAAPAGPAPATGAAVTAAAPAGTGRDGITREQAADAALAHVGGGRVVEAERDVEHGVPVWEVDVVRDGVEHDVDVDRRDATILRAELDDHGDDDRHDD